MNTPKHTPLPWIFDEVPTSCGRCFRIGSQEIIDGHEASKRQGARTLPAYACIYDDYGRGETVNKANAELIVRAVNSYADLVAAMEAILERKTRTALATIPGMGPTFITEPANTQGQMMEIARAALAKAKGSI